MARNADRPARRPAGAEAGFVRLHHADAIACSHGGVEYAADRNGDVLVPAAAAAELSAHGFVPAPAEA